MAQPALNQYEDARHDFQATVGAGVHAFARKRGLTMPTAKDLAAMTMSFEEMTAQVLGFGFNIWPGDTYEKDDDAGPISPAWGPNVVSFFGARARRRAIHHARRACLCIALLCAAVAGPAYAAHGVHTYQATDNTSADVNDHG